MSKKRETVEYDGDKYHRYPDSDRRQLRVYFWAHTSNNEPPKALHRQKYRDKKGEIPEGYVIHHKDGDPLNNDIENLESIPRGEHQSLHMSSPEMKEMARQVLKDHARPKAAEWHGSEEGKDWHKKHYEKTKDELHKKRYTHECEICGDEYQTNRKDKTKYCSDECRNKAQRQRNREKRKCVICGEEYETSKYSDGETCSRSCAGKLAQR